MDDDCHVLIILYCADNRHRHDAILLGRKNVEAKEEWNKNPEERESEEAEQDYLG